VMSVENFTVLREFSHVVDRHQWQACAFSGNSEFIVASPAVCSSRNMFVWSRHYGNLLTCIGTDAEHLMDLEFHPVRPICVSVSNVGHIWVWGQPAVQQQWSAFDTGFVHLKENMEFFPQSNAGEAERLRNELESRKAKLDELVDIVTKEPVAAFSDDEDQDFTPDIDSLRNEIIHLPSIPIPDEEQKRKRLHHSHITAKHNNAATITYVLSFGEKKKKRKAHGDDTSRKKQKIRER